MTTSALWIICLLVLASCGPSPLQARTEGYGAAYTQFGRD
jgi:hypothetical protein